METKPRLTAAEYMRISTYAPFSVAMLIERYVRAMNGLDTGKPIKLVSGSHLCTLRMLQRMLIGAKDARALGKNDIKDHVKARLATGIAPATAMHDVNYLSGVLAYAGSEWDDCDGITNAAILAAKPSLVKHGYISKSTPRKRVPTDDEIVRLLDYLAIPDKIINRLTITAMPSILAFALVSTRRLGEICRITHSDVDWERMTYWVRDMKHPTRKKHNDKEFCLFPELVEIIKRQPRKEGDDRIFPFNSHSVSAKFARAKQALGIFGLRFHDCRRAAITKWLKTLTPHQVKLISGHETTVILERVYDASDPADLHATIAKQQQALEVRA